MVLKSTNEQLKFWFITSTVLVSINLWSFQLIPDGIYTILDALVLLCLLVIVLYHHLILRKKLIFSNNVFFFMLIPVISAFGAYIFHDQAFSLSLLVLRLQLLWLFYLVLHIFNFSKETIIKLMIVVGIVWAVITIIQQFTYPVYYFSSRSEKRAGVYRFMVHGLQYGSFFLLYFFYQYLVKRKIYYLLLAILGLVGFYFYGTRQFALAAMACMFIATFMVRGRAQLNAITIFLIAVPLLIIFKDVLFAQHIEITKEQFQYGDNIRELSAKFWLNDYWPNHWVAKITGNGPTHELSSYGQEMKFIQVYYGFFRSDVGVIGAFNEFGLLYALNILWVNFKGLSNKYFTKNDKFLKLLFINSILLLLTSQSYSYGGGIPFYCLIFYLTDKAFEEKKFKEQELRLSS